MYVYAQDTNWNEVEFEDTFGRIFMRKNLIFMKFRRHTSKLDVLRLNIKRSKLLYSDFIHKLQKLP